jgi:hypothetical protein
MRKYDNDTWRCLEAQNVNWKFCPGSHAHFGVDESIYDLMGQYPLSIATSCGVWSIKGERETSRALYSICTISRRAWHRLAFDVTDGFETHLRLRISLRFGTDRAHKAGMFAANKLSSPRSGLPIV